MWRQAVKTIVGQQLSMVGYMFVGGGLLVVVCSWWFVGGDSRSTDYSLTRLLPSLNNI